MKPRFPAAEQTHLSDGELKLELEPNALVLVKLESLTTLLSNRHR